MNDRELLELAAKAVGRRFNDYDPDPEFGLGWCGKSGNDWWNPLNDDGDAFQLAVKLKIDIMFFDGFEEIHADYNDYIKGAVIEAYSDDMQSSVRRAITRAAAEIELAWGASE